MTLLITGGTGFVMSNLARRWLDADADARVVNDGLRRVRGRDRLGLERLGDDAVLTQNVACDIT